MEVRPLAAELVRGHGRRFLRYAGVSMVAVPLGQALLQIGLQVFNWHPVVANVVAVSLSAIPSYLLNRYWVWEKSGPNRLWGEIMPFWAMALAGLALSTLGVWVVAQYTDSALWVGVTNVSAFGVLWVLKYAVLHSWVFTHHHEPSEARTASVR